MNLGGTFIEKSNCRSAWNNYVKIMYKNNKGITLKEISTLWKEEKEDENENTEYDIIEEHSKNRQRKEKVDSNKQLKELEIIRKNNLELKELAYQRQRKNDLDNLNFFSEYLGVKRDENDTPRDIKIFNYIDNLIKRGEVRDIFERIPNDELNDVLNYLDIWLDKKKNGAEYSDFVKLVVYPRLKVFRQLNNLEKLLIAHDIATDIKLASRISTPTMANVVSTFIYPKIIGRKERNRFPEIHKILLNYESGKSRN